MGYDMYAVEQVDSPSTPRFASPNYFHLNIWGMGTARQIMLDLDMLNAEVEHGVWPDAPSDEEWVEREKVEPGSEWAKFHEENDAVLSAHPNRDDPRTPAFKFCSNDGWIVTPVECKAMVGMARDGRAEGKDLPEWWDEWIGWLDHCSTHGGFYVN